MNKRSVDVVVMSDLHLGTYGCHAKEIIQYLQSISPKTLILNGDIIDGWQFSKHFFPASHLQVIREILQMADNGTRVIYITGNHDEFLRKYSDTQIGNFYLTDKIVVELNGKKTWIFHGDVFDATTKGSAKIIAKLGGHGYDLLILLNSFINWIAVNAGMEKMSFSKKIKNSVKKAVAWIDNFENTAAELAIKNGYDYVICGHIHQPKEKVITNQNGEKVTYLNSGDWVENLTALEHNANEWSIYTYKKSDFPVLDNVRIQKKYIPKVETDLVHFYINSLIP
jgi:UDP-2,3-diacylglucosamine pyrophosphatase LpxH